MMRAEREELVLRSSGTKRLWLGLMSAGFVAVGLWMVRSGNPQGWLVFGFFALCLMVFCVWMLFPNANYLRLTQDGFEMRAMFRSHFYRWRDVAAFEPVRIYGGKYVSIIFAPTYLAAPIGRDVSAALTGIQGMLPDTYGMTAEALADLLNDWRVRYRTPQVNWPGRPPGQRGPRLPN